MEAASPNVGQHSGSENTGGIGQMQSVNASSSSTSNGPMSKGVTSMAPSEAEKLPRWQLDLIMEKIRRKSNQLKPLGETSKNIRTALSERRYFLDPGDRVHLQKSLDSLQQSIKVNSLQSMVERLEMVSRQLGLKFTPGATGNEWFISSDMFYLELLIDPLGIVQEVKIQHDGKTEQQNVPEMVDCLRRNDFTDFTAHLEGLVAIYQLNADKKIKSKAFIALQALEADLLAMSTTYSHITDGEQIVMKSLLGLLQPRKGGHPVKLVYFISPYEFLDVSTKTTLPTDVQTILDKKIGTIATVSIQSSTSRKLQMSTTVSIVRAPDGKSVPRYGTLNATNSTALPACFTVNLGKPIPVCKDLLQAIQVSTGIHCFDFSNPQPILSMVTRHASNGTLDCTNDRGVFVALPDKPDTPQVHCYFMTETPNLEGIMVSSINFTLASQLPQVIAILRQQLIFNTLVASCVRIGSKPEMKCIVFEVNALSHQNVSVSFQNPLEDSLVTLEFDLRDVSHPQCRLHAVTNAADIIPTLEEHACKVVQRSLSIPITVRAVIRRWQTMKSKFEPPNPEFTIPLGGSYGSDTLNQLQSSDISCGAESERAQTQQQPSSNPMVPGVVMSLSGTNSGNNNMNNNPNNSSSLSSSGMTNPNVLNSNNMNHMSSAGRHSSGSGGSSYTISPIHNNNVTPSSGNVTTNFQTPNQNQNSVELISSYLNPMNPLYSLSNQLNMGGNLPGNFPNLHGLSLQNLQNLHSLTGLLDQVGQRGRRRKRKGTSSDSGSTQALSTGPGMHIQGNATVPRPSPSPSPKSPRMLPNKSPKRRPSEGSDISDTSQGDNTRAPTPQTPLTPRGDGSNTAINLLMSEIGLDIPDARWNIDITPVGGTSGTTISSNPNSAQSIENFLASKLLSGFGSAAAAAGSNIANVIGTTNNSNSNLPSDFQIENFDSDMEIDPSEIGVSGFMGNSNKFSMPQNKKLGGKKPRDFPKRSISLDSHSTSLDDHLAGGNLQSFINSAAGSVGTTGQGDTSGVGSDFKPLVTPSLSITPVSTNSSMGQTTVNSLLAAIRPGIEIIPLPNPVQIPNSITVTPIHPKPMMQLTDNTNALNKKSTSTTSALGKDNKKGVGDDNTTISNISEGNTGTTLKKKLSGTLSEGTTKKERKRKAPNLIPPLLDEEGLPVHDYNPSKQPKLLGPFGNIPTSNSGSSFAPINDKKGNSAGMSMSLKGASPTFGGLKKPGSPSLNRAPTPNKSGSPTPKIGGKPSVSTLKSVSGSPKYPDVQPSSNKGSKLNKERKGSFQGNPKIAKNLSMVGNPGTVPNLMPSLKSLNEGSLPLSLASFNPSLLGLSGNAVANLKAEHMAEALMPLMKANLLSKSVMEANKAQMQPSNQNSVGQSPSQVAQAAAAASVAAQIQRSNSTGSNNGNSAGAAGGGNSGVGIGIAGKKGGLLAVIDKLKSQHSGDDSSKKDMSKMDYLKASSAITSDVMQLTQQQKKNQNQSGGSTGSSGGSSANNVNVSNNNNNNNNITGSNFSNNPEYMVKPGGQGLKMTLGKTKSSNSSTKLNAIKDKFKSGLKTSGSKKGFSGVKLPAVATSALSQQSQPLSSSGSKMTPGLTGVSGSGTNIIKKSSGSNSNSSNSGSSKNLEKDLSPSVENKTSSKSVKNSGNASGGGSTSGSKPRAEDELDLTRKLFQPGSGVFDAPKFDFTKYQIPKKSSNSTIGPGSTTTSGTVNSENSPKPLASPSPSGSGNGKSDSKDSFSKEIEKISSLTSIDSPQQSGSGNKTVDLTKDSAVKDKEIPGLTTLHSSSVLDLVSAGSGNFGSSVLLSGAAVSTEPKNLQPGLSSAPSQNTSESTKIILSSSSIGSSEISFSEVNKLFSKSSFASVGSPINLSHNSNTLSSQSLSHIQMQGQGQSGGTQKHSASAAPSDSCTSFGEPDSTTNEPSNATSGMKKADELRALNAISTAMAKEMSTSGPGVSKMQSSTFSANSSGPSANAPDNFVSPESPDPLNCIQDDVIYKNTLTIPTTPQNAVASVTEESNVMTKQSPALPSPDDDQLIMDIASESVDKKTGDSSSSNSNSANSNSSVGSSSGTAIAASSSVSNGSTHSLLSSFGRESLDDSLPNKISKESIFMPPPPVPDSTSTSGSSSGFNSSIGGSSLTSSMSTGPSSITSHVNIASSSQVAPVTNTTSTSIPTASAVTATVPIVSVHIVHSPQPNSPALLRSPLVVQSPHSSHASPYAIDDDLMDEALIGTGK